MSHRKAALRVVRYLRTTANCALPFRRSGFTLSAYVDADFAMEHDRKSITGYVILLGDNIIAWRSSKQRLVTLSTCESEYVALSACAREVMIWRTFMAELGWPQGEPTVIRTDSAAAKALAEASTTSQRSKHIDLRFHHVRELIDNGDIVLEKVSSAENLADVLTKPLASVAFKRITDRLFDATA